MSSIYIEKTCTLHRYIKIYFDMLVQVDEIVRIQHIWGYHVQQECSSNRIWWQEHHWVYIQDCNKRYLCIYEHVHEVQMEPCRILQEKYIHKYTYRLGPLNSNTVNSKFILIQTFVKTIATFLSFQC